MKTQSSLSVHESEDQSPIVMAEGVELFLGMNDIPLLYVEKRQSYVRLSTLGADIVRMLLDQPQSLTTSAIEQALTVRYPGKEDDIRQKLPPFLQHLHQSSVITLPGVEKGATNVGEMADRLVKKASRRPMLKWGLVHPKTPLAEDLVGRLAGLSGDTLKTGFALWFMGAALTAGYANVVLGTQFAWGQIVWPLVVGAFLLHLILHELSHTLVSSYYHVRVRELGIALLYYFLPVAYADRTDGYRLRDPKQRMHIALAGPALDLSAAAITALLALTTGGWLAASCHLLLVIETMTFLSNLNPLMPSDGYHALEAASGELNFRQRTFLLLWHWITFRQPPAHLRTLTARQKILYFGYALLMVSYIGLVALFVAKFVVTTILGVIKL